MPVEGMLQRVRILRVNKRILHRYGSGRCYITFHSPDTIPREPILGTVVSTMSLLEFMFWQPIELWDADLAVLQFLASTAENRVLRGLG
jgi:hypothetical protein